MEKKKYLVRLVAGAAALCVSAAVVAPSPAGAQSATGVGTTEVSHTLLSASVGSLLELVALKDIGRSGIETAIQPAGALARLEVLKLKSSVLPALEAVSDKFPVFESSAPGGQGSVSGNSVDLGSSSLVPGLPLKLTGGTLSPTNLSAALNELGAKSALDSAINLNVLSDILSIRGVNNRMTTAASLPSADGTRSLEIGKIDVLTLGDLLAGLLLPLVDLPLSVIDGLVENLKLQVPLLAGNAELTQVTNALSAAITDVVNKGSGALPQQVKDVPGVNLLLGEVSKTVPKVLTGTTLVDTSTLATGTVQDLLDTLRATLAALLNQVLGLLGDLPLVSLGGANISVATKAAPTLADSAAVVTAAVSPVSILGIPLGGVDLTTVGDLTKTASGVLGGVLGAVHSSLANLVSVGVLEKNTAVNSDGVYNTALATFNLLRLDIKPPADLLNIVSGLTGNSALSSKGTLSAAGVANPAGSLPVLGGNALGLGNLLNLPATVGALSKGLSVKVGAIESRSRFRLASAPAAAVAAPAPAPGATLPRTGGDTGTLGILAAGMAALALGVRRWARRPETD